MKVLFENVGEHVRTQFDDERLNIQTIARPRIEIEP